MSAPICVLVWYNSISLPDQSLVSLPSIEAIVMLLVLLRTSPCSDPAQRNTGLVPSLPTSSIATVWMVITLGWPFRSMALINLPGKAALMSLLFSFFENYGLRYKPASSEMKLASSGIPPSRIFSTKAVILSEVFACTRSSDKCRSLVRVAHLWQQRPYRDLSFDRLPFCQARCVSSLTAGFDLMV